MIGSVAVHAVLVWLIAAGDRDGAPTGTGAAPAPITIVEAVDVDLLPTEEAPPREPGGAPAGGAPSLARQARAIGARSRSIETEDPRGAITIDHADPRGELANDGHDASGLLSSDALAFDGRGMGLGNAGRGGAGRGTGIGFGDGGTIQRIENLSPPPAPRASLARPARLIFPTRQRDVEDAELFIARVIVDDDGFVAGAKLVRGFGGRRDEVASTMIWKFRYDPARDDEGRAIRSTFDQRFLVGP